MCKLSFNPVNSLISLVVGWFVMSFLQSAFRSLAAGSWEGLGDRFRAIALFQDSRGSAINLVLIVVIGIVTSGLWFLARRR